MALFKILKGNSARISTDVTPFHDGYAYFTTDDGGFYIDAEADGIQKRYKINEKSSGGGTSVVEAETVLSASGWTGNTQTITVQDVTETSSGRIAPAQTITADQMSALAEANISVTGQDDGSITLTAFGTVPNVDIPILISTVDNSGAKEQAATLTAAEWTDNSQTLEVPSVTEATIGTISPAQNITEEQMYAMIDAVLNVSAQGTNSITVTALGKVPSVDIPVIVAIMS